MLVFTDGIEFSHEGAAIDYLFVFLPFLRRAVGGDGQDTGRDRPGSSGHELGNVQAALGRCDSGTPRESVFFFCTCRMDAIIIIVKLRGSKPTDINVF